MLTDMPSPTNKKELQPFLGIMSYLDKLLSATAEVCKLLQRLTSTEAD